MMIIADFIFIVTAIAWAIGSFFYFRYDFDLPTAVVFSPLYSVCGGGASFYAVKFVMDTPKDINLLPGMSARVFAEHQSGSDELSEVYVPAHSVLEDSQGRFVYLAVESIDGSAEVQRRAVVVGELNENGLQVLQGLDIGDKVITAGMSKISQGLVVRIMAEG